MPRSDASRYEALISRYKQRIFALTLYLIGGDQDRAYDICSTGFAETLRTHPHLDHEEAFLAAVIGNVVEKSRAAKAIPDPNVLDFLELSCVEKKPLSVVLRALQTLDFDARTLVLLRDQLNLPYKQIAIIARSSEEATRSQANQVHVQLRKNIEDALHGAS